MLRASVRIVLCPEFFLVVIVASFISHILRIIRWSSLILWKCPYINFIFGSFLCNKTGISIFWKLLRTANGCREFDYSKPVTIKLLFVEHAISGVLYIVLYTEFKRKLCCENINWFIPHTHTHSLWAELCVLFLLCFVRARVVARWLTYSPTHSHLVHSNKWQIIYMILSDVIRIAFFRKFTYT